MPVDLIVVGHVGTETVQTPFGTARSLGGAAYYAAVAARHVGATVGIVSTVGRDYPIQHLEDIGLDIRGIIVLDGPSSHFEISYLPSFNDRYVGVTLGVGSYINVANAPKGYFEAPYIHVATNLPPNQLQLIRDLRSRSHGFIAMDCFDQFIHEDPETVLACIRETDLYFANEREATLLRSVSEAEKPHVLKRGARGAVYHSGNTCIEVPAPQIELIDPTGAGDACAGAFLGSLSRGVETVAALKSACEIASLCASAYGALGLLSPNISKRLSDGR